MAEISNGVWFDTRTNTVVDSQPEEGVQIVAPGTEMNSNLEADIQRYRDQGDGNAPAVNTVTTADVQPDEKKTASKSK